MYEELTDIGEEHHIKLILDDDGQPIELIEYHFDQKGKMCGGAKTIGDGNWIIMSADPPGPSIMPSIQCDVCPSHGFIIQGYWYEHDDPTVAVQLAELWTEYHKLVPEEIQA